MKCSNYALCQSKSIGAVALRRSQNRLKVYRHRGQIKFATYILDFVNSSEDILAAFKTFYEIAELEGVTDPNLVYDLRAKLDGSGHYDDFEVDRVVAVEMNPKAKQGDLIAAIEPVADRLLRRFKQAQEKLRIALATDDAKAAEEAKGEINALVLFKADLGAFQRMYSFLSQILDYGNTAIEKRFIFYKRLLPLLEFGREREGIDLSKVILTHPGLKDQGKRQLILGEGESPKLQPLTEAGAGSVQEKEKARLEEIIAKVNDLFEGDPSDITRIIVLIMDLTPQGTKASISSDLEEIGHVQRFCRPALPESRKRP